MDRGARESEPGAGARQGSPAHEIFDQHALWPLGPYSVPRFAALNGLGQGGHRGVRTR